MAQRNERCVAVGRESAKVVWSEGVNQDSCQTQELKGVCLRWVRVAGAREESLVWCQSQNAQQRQQQRACNFVAEVMVSGLGVLC